MLVPYVSKDLCLYVSPAIEAILKLLKGQCTKAVSEDSAKDSETASSVSEIGCSWEEEDRLVRGIVH